MPDDYSTTPQDKNTIKALWHLQKLILDTLDFKQVVQRIVDGLLTELGYLQLGYRIIVLTLVDETNNELRRISLSQTEEALKAQQASAVPFQEIKIPLSAKDNLLIKTLNEKRPYVTHYWPDIFTPILTSEQAVANQTAAGIKTSMIYPVIVKEKSIGVLIFSMIKEEKDVSEVEKELINGFTDIVGLAVQNSRLYSALEDTTVQLSRANDRLHELDTLKSEFVSVASHELRTPMTAIKSYLWMALAGKGGNINDKQKYYLERAYISTDRLIKLVNDLLNVSRIESGKLSMEPAKLSVEQFVDEVISEVKPRADELGIRIINGYNPQEPLPPVLGDSDKLKEVVINIIGNSLKFTPKDGSITFSYETSGGFVTTHVKDTGEGIAPEDLPKLFQKFGLVRESYVTNQKASQGTGLGLYISKAIIDLHGGKMWAESEGHGKGATFSFSLPVFNQEALDQAMKNKKENGLGVIHSTID
ncbi:MAG: hypothetical protein UY21_C0003G0005 [Microgenomates group bacterium GW2011_GWA1_48_10]|nr:MAG: hypothetical protein UY21_C0003G0005 [Microgenomates group bacterium GW2011_GWA1_48_10]